MSLNYGVLNNSFSTSHDVSGGDAPQRRLSADLDLSEFMINTDIDFFGKFPDITRPYIDAEYQAEWPR